ncbi:unnamed protein product [Mytilus coruscus]|uniref:GOLD domain-containing protein n=1 Tax=Mytilus coruscus TaxID=42192 RepID=A0A6J8A0H8_MYTCO|nr:unnamed protein product [Mytilus coruscus]
MIFNSLNAEQVLDKQNEDFDFDGLPGVTYEFKIEVYSGREQCFYQKIANGATLHLSFEVTHNRYFLLLNKNKVTDTYYQYKTWSHRQGHIAITTFNRNQVIENILQEVELIIELFNKYPKSKLTFLETPLYSIVEWNRNKRHPDITEFYEQNIELEEQIVQLNKQIKLINNRIGSYSPKFSSDLACNTKYKKGLCHNKLTKRHHHNFNLYKDSIHPKKLLAVTWLKKITEEILKDCWH